MSPTRLKMLHNPIHPYDQTFNISIASTLCKSLVWLSILKCSLNITWWNLSLLWLKLSQRSYWHGLSLSNKWRASIIIRVIMVTTSFIHLKISSDKWPMIRSSSYLPSLEHLPFHLHHSMETIISPSDWHTFRMLQ